MVGHQMNSGGLANTCNRVFNDSPMIHSSGNRNTAVIHQPEIDAPANTSLLRATDAREGAHQFASRRRITTMKNRHSSKDISSISHDAAAPRLRSNRTNDAR